MYCIVDDSILALYYVMSSSVSKNQQPIRIKWENGQVGRVSQNQRRFLLALDSNKKELLGGCIITYIQENPVNELTVYSDGCSVVIAPKLG